jgi:hypothetical protein
MTREIMATVSISHVVTVRELLCADVVTHGAEKRLVGMGTRKVMLQSDAAFTKVDRVPRQAGVCARAVAQR